MIREFVGDILDIGVYCVVFGEYLQGLFVDYIWLGTGISPDLIACSWATGTVETVYAVAGA